MTERGGSEEEENCMHSGSSGVMHVIFPINVPLLSIARVEALEHNLMLSGGHKGPLATAARCLYIGRGY